MKAIKNFIFLLALSFSVAVIAQKKETKKKDVNISILVKDTDNKPVPGAIILFDDVKQKRRTNSKGYFKVKLDKAPKEISAFYPTIGIKKVKYNNSKNMVITIKKGNDHYVIGDAKKKGLNPIQYRSIYDYIRGQVPGVHVNPNNEITIRGYNTVNGSLSPLFVVNGNAVDQDIFGNIVPTNIKSVTILKGTDTAHYGARGANGVIKVETF